jgi:RNA polymerase II-associated factor 1
MIVDAECGMPLDLGQWECLWEEDADDSSVHLSGVQRHNFCLTFFFVRTALNPDPSNLPPLDPKDALLLADPSTSTAAFPLNGNSISNNAQPTFANVSWLRKTEYITRESSQRQIGQEPYVLLFSAQMREFLSFS